jgi:lysophospholipase L1-like esterase
MNERADSLSPAAGNNTAPRRPRLSVFVATWIVSIVMTLGLAEIVLRIYIDMFALRSNGSEESRLLQGIPGSDRVYGMLPGLAPPIKTNSFGFRGREITLAKPAGVFRILMLGDSITYGNSVNWDETFSYRLEERLNNTRAAPRFQVLNLGVSGYNTSQELATLRELGLKFAPDVIVLNVCLNDSDPVKQLYGVSLKNKTRITGWSDVNLRTIVDISYVLTLLKHASTDVLKAAGVDVKSLNSPGLFLDSRVREKAWQLMKNDMREIHATAKSAGMPLTAIIYPYSSQLSLSSENRVPQQDLIGFFSTEQVPAMDATPVYQDLGQAMFVDGYIHLSAQGHARIAAAIEKHLALHEMLPATTSTAVSNRK